MRRFQKRCNQGYTLPTMFNVSTQDLIARLAAGPRAYAIIAVVALLACLPGFFSLPPLDRDESRYAQASVQMLESGDLVRLYVQKDPRYKKPIGVHWLQAASVSLTSDPAARAIWPYRLPSMLGAILAALATFWGGCALVGRPAAFVGATLFAASLMLSTEGMIAKTDALLCAITALAMGALARLKLGQTPTLPLVLAVWGFAAVGALIKGPVTPLLMALTMVTLCAWERRIEWLRPLFDWRGFALAGAIVAPWGVAILIATKGAFFTESFFGDVAPKLTGDGEHKGLPFGTHTLLAPALLFPVTLGLVPGLIILARALRAPRAGPVYAPIRFLVAWAAPFWVLMEIVSTKLPHYTLPTYPALALAAGAGLMAWPNIGRLARVGQVILFAFGGAFLIGLCAYGATLLPGDANADSRRAFQTGLFGAIALIALTIFVFTTQRLERAALMAIVFAIALHWQLRERILPEARTVLISREASLALARHDLHPRAREGGEALLVVGYREPSLVFMTRTDTLLRQGVDAAAIARPGQAVLLEGREGALFSAGLAARELAFRPIGSPVTGTNYSNGDEVALQPGRIIEAKGARVRTQLFLP
jgi:4-amino-4-deoxy-L-arabinose transferase-like glycosyltransferase